MLGRRRDESYKAFHGEAKAYFQTTSLAKYSVLVLLGWSGHSGLGDDRLLAYQC